MSFASSSSSPHVGPLSDQQIELVEMIRRNGRVTSSDLTRLMGKRIDGNTLLTLQVRVMECRLGRVRKETSGRFIYYWYEPA